MTRNSEKKECREKANSSSPTLLAREGPLQILATRKAHQNHAVLDPWTAVHFSSGLACGLMDAPFEASVTAAVAYEFVEQYVERQTWGKELFQTSRPETLLNAVMDVAVFTAGHWLGRAWNRTGARTRG